MKKANTMHALLFVMGWFIIIPIGMMIYGAIWGFPDTPAPVFLNRDGEPFAQLAVGEVWEEDDFTVQLRDVQMGEADENGMRLCEFTIWIKNDNLVMYKNSKKLRGFVHHNRDSENAYRGWTGTVTDRDKENITEPEEKVENLMEIIVSASTYLPAKRTWLSLKRMELNSFYIPKGAEAVYHYQIMIPENAQEMELNFIAWFYNRDNEGYRKEYRFNPADYLKE